MPTAKVNGVELYYEVHGQGYPVVLINGFTGTTEGWTPQIAPLSSKYRLILHDVRGHGRSESPPSADAYSPDIVAEDLRQLLDTLGVKEAVVGGLSMGGYLSLRFHLRYPERVAALILADTGPGYRNPARQAAWNQQYEERAQALEKEGKIGLAHVGRRVVTQRDSLVIESLSQIKVPTLIIVGEGDAAFLAAADYMEKVIPGAQRVTLHGAGHAANRDNAEAFNQAIMDFLSQFKDTNAR
ncbi:MAG: alpha/beta fold hydrolase [Chloroflexi bacterium]|nr:alpha/beta fold hydrolase [Chloroflexota bacterium]